MEQPQKPVTPSAQQPTTSIAPTTTSATSAPKPMASSPARDAQAPSTATAATPFGLFAMTAFLDNEQPASGVAIVTNNDPAGSAVSMATVADSIVRDGKIADQPTCPVSRIALLHASGPRGPVPLKAFASSAVKAKLREVPISHCSHFDPLKPEGVHIVLNHLKPRECVFVQVDYNDLTRDAATIALSELNMKAEELGALVVMFLSHLKKHDVSWLQNHCRAFVQVGMCEPGPGAQNAVVLTNMSLSGWHPHGIGRVMVEAFFEGDNGWSYRAEPFVAERAVPRLSWYLRTKGVAVEKIAQLVGMHKSNISRGLDALLISPANTVGLKPPQGWITRWAARYKLDDVLPRKGPDAGVAGDGAQAPDSPKNDGPAQASKETPKSAASRTHPTSPHRF